MIDIDKCFGGYQFFLWDFWYPCVGRQAMSFLGYQGRGRLASVVTCMLWIPQIHLPQRHLRHFCRSAYQLNPLQADPISQTLGLITYLIDTGGSEPTVVLIVGHEDGGIAVG